MAPYNRQSSLTPKDALLQGVKILEPILAPNGFVFQFCDEGNGSGGDFAWGKFVRNDRSLELHFRRSLGLVSYHVKTSSASHESYMRELGVWTQCRYPSFSGGPMDAFEGLAHDLSFADDFLKGRAVRLKQAAAMEKINANSRKAQDMARSVGDTRKRDELRASFRLHNYTAVVELARTLKYPNLMSESERNMVEFARGKILTV